MDGLDAFEKSLAAEKAEREREEQERAERKENKHRHHHRRERSSDRDRKSRHHRAHDRESDEERHRHKRSRHHRDEEGESKHRSHRHRDREDGQRERRRDRNADPNDPEYLQTHDPKEDLPLPDEEKTPEKEGLVRDSWMTAPSAIDIDYVQRKKKEPTPPPKQTEQRAISSRELNSGILQDLNAGKTIDDLDLPAQHDVDYTFGDAGSQWRMTRLNAVFTTAEQTGRPADEIALERYGSLQEFDDAREEKMEIDRRRLYGEGFVGKEKPTGELYKERKKGPEPKEVEEPEPQQGVPMPEQTRAVPMDQTALNRLRAQMMKAKLRKAPDAAKLEAEYNAAMATFSSGINNDRAVVLDASHNRMLAGPRGEVKNVENKRGRERGQVVANEDMSIEDMVREERRTRGQVGGEGLRLAERIAKDGKFDNDLEYLDENAEKLAKRVHKSETSLKNVAVNEFQKMNKILDSCPLCHHEERQPPQNQPIAPIISLATRVFLTLPTEPELTGAEGGAVIVPISHRNNLLECDDDEWEEIRNFMKSLTRLFHDQGREVLFYENAAAPQRRLHAALVAVPIPYDLGDTAPAFFREAMLSADEEWSQHKKIIDTGKKAREGLGRLAFRRSIAKEMPYFHVWFNLDGGLGHVVEDASRWPKGDLFAREIIGGMVDAEPDVIKRQGRWNRSDPRLDGFKKRWRKFDWTRVLTEGQ
ncbi:uncharacterized protein E0L32_006905 [Thyridium curvatum]|uniref:Cell cycle control protein cwf19 n=1 Tax=Thyridium curvatum TaxID=1093900 RepID=A0A507AXX7_9PEZI|nr:uncharacterized protein E0L32_006905 [Thyridium curvatum]TPX12493.1 hypothetical protein E0L32_006905 [Thyridium curvatum]